MLSPGPSGKTDSRSLSRQLALRLLRRIDLRRHPVQRVDAGRSLRPSGRPLDALPYIEAGRMDAVLPLGDSGTQVIPVTFGRGELAVLSALFSTEPILGALVAAEPMQVRWLPLKEVEAALLEDRELLVLLVRFLAQRLREAQRRERGWLERGLRGRVRAVLARIALEAQPEADAPWRIAATHEHLAQRCGVSRPKLSAELKQLEKAGIVRLRRGAIELVDYAALSRGE